MRALGSCDRDSWVKCEEIEKNQQGATIRCLLLTSVSTFLGHNDARNMLRQKLIINI